VKPVSFLRTAGRLREGAPPWRGREGSAGFIRGISLALAQAVEMVEIGRYRPESEEIRTLFGGFGPRPGPRSAP
jgi:hypothetical protein